MVDARTAGLISLFEHDRIVEELTEALRKTAELVGEELLPAKAGYDWFEALEKHAPKKAAAFTAKDPIKELFPYAVYILDIHENKVLADSMIMDLQGVVRVLEMFTAFTESNRAWFKEQLINIGNAKVDAKGDTVGYTHYIVAVDRSKYAMDSRGVLIRLDRFGRAVTP